MTGVILFNYAFSITIPSWLNEKKSSVSVNQVIWSATILSSIIYISFGILASISFASINSNMLIILASKQVSIIESVF